MTNWKEKTHRITKDDVLNQMDYSECGIAQQMIYLVLKKMEELEDKIKDLETRITTLEGE